MFLQPGLHPSESPPCIYIYPVYIYIYTLIWTIHMLFILLHLNHVQHFLNLFYKVSLTYFSGICLTSVIGSTKGDAIPLRTFFNQWKLQQISLSLNHEIKRASSIFLPFCIPYVRISGEMWLSTHALAKTLKRKTHNSKIQHVCPSRPVQSQWILHSAQKVKLKNVLFASRI